MEKEKINIAELLKDCPKGMELDCAIWDNCTFDGIEDIGYINILVKTPNGQIKLSKEGCFVHNCNSAKCVIFPKGKTTWEGFVPPCKFKDGDVLLHTQNDRFVMSIYKSNESETIINTYTIFWDRGEGLSVGMQICCYTDSTRLATEKEKQKLFQAIKDNGYRWNEETKTLEKLPKFKVGDKVKHKCDKNNTVITITGSKHDYYYIQYYNNKKNEYQNESISFTDQDKYELVIDKFDINTLKPFDKVLARHGKDNNWTATFFSHIDEKLYCHCYKFVTTNGSYPYVIPYEENKHLLGTTADCNDYYKTWLKTN